MSRKVHEIVESAAETNADLRGCNFECVSRNEAKLSVKRCYHFFHTVTDGIASLTVKLHFPR